MTQNRNQPAQEASSYQFVEAAAQQFPSKVSLLKEIDTMDAQFSSRPLVLIGLSGAGKSTIGAKLAAYLNKSFVDMDVLFEEQVGQSIPSYFEQYGEPAFRDEEERILQEVLAQGFGVIATGGGTILREESRTALKEKARVIYLDTGLEELYIRLLGDEKRPMLKGAGLMERLQQLNKERRHLYMECAHLMINSNEHSEDGVVELIVSGFDLQGDKSKAK